MEIIHLPNEILLHILHYLNAYHIMICFSLSHEFNTVCNTFQYAKPVVYRFASSFSMHFPHLVFETRKVENENIKHVQSLKLVGFFLEKPLSCTNLVKLEFIFFTINSMNHAFEMLRQSMSSLPKLRKLIMNSVGFHLDNVNIILPSHVTKLTCINCYNALPETVNHLKCSANVLSQHGNFLPHIYKLTLICPDIELRKLTGEKLLAFLQIAPFHKTVFPNLKVIKFTHS